YQKHLTYRGQSYPLAPASAPEVYTVTHTYRGVQYTAIAGEALPQPRSLTYRGVRSNPVATPPEAAPIPVPQAAPTPPSLSPSAPQPFL
ncbi:MAG: DUF4278 domain-containing protein, partial [Prochlorothrix sp.]